jgi:hypothetical protein
LNTRDRIAAAAEEHGWAVGMGTDQTWNVRIYTRGDRVILVGYTQAGAITGATRMYGGVTESPRKDMPMEQLDSRDRDKTDTVLGWLAESG